METLSYTPEEVAKLLKVTRFTVYEMIKRGDFPAYRIGRKMRIEAADVEAYIKKSKGSIRTMASSQVPANPAAPATSEEMIICGQDPVLDILTRHLEKQLPQVRILRNYVGSIDGLSALYHGRANVATTHLWDSDTDSYNTPYVRRLLPGHPVLIVNLVYRTAGFFVTRDNPLGLHHWTDLLKPGIRLVNRERGSGARVLLDEKLRAAGLDRNLIGGYDREETSHLAVASCVARGEADVGIGTEKAALQVANIDFVPMQQERYDLVIRREDAGKPAFQAMLSILRSPAFRNEIEGMGGYDLKQIGQIIAEI